MKRQAPNFVGPSYNLDSKPASVQRTINMVPVPLEPGNERTGWVFEDVPGLSVFHDGNIAYGTTWDEDYISGNGALSNGDLTFSETDDDNQTWTRSVHGMTSGKFYWELAISAPTGGANCDQFIGIREASEVVGTNLASGDTVTLRTQGALPGNAIAVYVGSSGATASLGVSGIDNLGDDDVVAFAFDATQGKLWFRSLNSVQTGVAGTAWFNTGNNPETDASPHVSDIPAGTWHIFCGVDNDVGDNVCVLRTRATEWVMQPPAGFGEIVQS